jgi:hypothetical protein
MAKYSAGVAALVLAVCTGLATPSYAQALGYVRVTFAKAGLIAGAGGGRGVLTYRGHDYSFRVSGLSLDVSVGPSVMRLTGRVSGLRELKDFSGSTTPLVLTALWSAVLAECTDQQERRRHHASGREAGLNLRPTGAGSGSRCRLSASPDPKWKNSCNIP